MCIRDRYGEEFEFADVPAGYWAETYIYSTKILGWLQGGADGLFHPEREITRAEAVSYTHLDVYKRQE